MSAIEQRREEKEESQFTVLEIVRIHDREGRMMMMVTMS